MSSLNEQRLHLASSLEAEVSSTIAAWRSENKMARLWSKDATLWTSQDEAKWLGWLGLARPERAREPFVVEAAAQGKQAKQALLLGMGGSSLCPEVLSQTLGHRPGYAELSILDSTDPAQIAQRVDPLDWNQALCIVSSKSGTTLEPNVMAAYTLEAARSALGARAASHFVAITDPGSELEKLARREGFRAIYAGEPSVGGRFSALSPFGLVPAAIMGIDVEALLVQASAMAAACGPDGTDNPGLALGVTMGLCARQGIDKLTLVVSPAIADLGAWLEQLVAESLGKRGKAVIPIDREPLGSPEVYGKDRLFVHLRLVTAADRSQDAKMAAIKAAGHPVVTIDVTAPEAIAQEFFRWEIATAVAGSVLGIHPFDQPDVEAAKVETRTLAAEYEQKGSLPDDPLLIESEGFRLYADARNARALKGDSLTAVLAAHLRQLSAGDYFALLAYVPMTEAHEAKLSRLRQRVLDSTRTATCLGFGPRYLHSTGQAHKGGPNSGVFIVLVSDDAVDRTIPGRPYTFGVLKAAQASGDFRVLAERGRRVLKIAVGKDVSGALDRLDTAFAAALS